MLKYINSRAQFVQESPMTKTKCHSAFDTSEIYSVLPMNMKIFMVKNGIIIFVAALNAQEFAMHKSTNSKKQYPFGL